MLFGYWRGFIDSKNYSLLKKGFFFFFAAKDLWWTKLHWHAYLLALCISLVDIIPTMFQNVRLKKDLITLIFCLIISFLILSFLEIRAEHRQKSISVEFKFCYGSTPWYSKYICNTEMDVIWILKRFYWFEVLFASQEGFFAAKDLWWTKLHWHAYLLALCISLVDIIPTMFQNKSMTLYNFMNS